MLCMGKSPAHALGGRYGLYLPGAVYAQQ